MLSSTPGRILLKSITSKSPGNWCEITFQKSIKVSCLGDHKKLEATVHLRGDHGIHHQ